MTRHLLRTALMALLLTGVAAHAQRIAFVDTKYILEQMPEYAAATVRASITPTPSPSHQRGTR